MTSNRDRALAVRGMQALAKTGERDGALIIPAVSIYETDEAFMVGADMPGAEKDSIEVRAEAGSLIIRAAVGGGNFGPAITQRRVYVRQFILTDGIDFTKASAEFRDGVLTVRLPKTSQVQRRDIPIRGE